MKRSLLVLTAAMLTLAACEKKEENTEMTTTAVEPAPAPAATPMDTMAAMSSAGAPGAAMDTSKVITPKKPK
jgi:ABC-type uncharacterized transport system auxiliary subunit